MVSPKSEENWEWASVDINLDTHEITETDWRSFQGDIAIITIRYGRPWTRVHDSGDAIVGFYCDERDFNRFLFIRRKTP